MRWRFDDDAVAILLPDRRHVIIVDAADADRVADRTWRVKTQRSGREMPVADVYNLQAGRGRETTLGRFVLFGEGVPTKPTRVTTKDGNPFDARRANLRAQAAITFRRGRGRS